MFILQTQKVKLREVKWLSQGTYVGSRKPKTEPKQPSSGACIAEYYAIQLLGETDLLSSGAGRREEPLRSMAFTMRSQSVLSSSVCSIFLILVSVKVITIKSADNYMD